MRDRLDVRLKLGVVLRVVRRVIADDVDQRHLRPPGVVEICESVAQPWPQVQQRGCRPPRHPRVAVGGARRHSLEQGEHGPHLGDRVERGHEVHLRCARI